MYEELENQQKQQLTQLINEYSDVFSSGLLDLGRSKVASHRIDTGRSFHINMPPYMSSLKHERRYDVKWMKCFKLELSDRLQVHGHHQWFFPPKNDGSSRFCVDFRRLNAMTRKDRYPLPRIDDSFDLLQGQQFFSTLDLQSGYWQIPVEEDDKEKTAFISPSGLFEFNVLTFGLCNGPVTFQRAMDSAFAGLKWRGCLHGLPR